MSWLVTGGAGYIGSHVVRAFLAEGIDAVVLDDLSSGRDAFVPDGVPFVAGTHPRRRAPRAHARRARRHRRRPRRRLQVRRRLGAAPAAHLRAERHGTAIAARRDGRTPASTASSSPPAPPSTARRTSTSSPRTPRSAPSRPTASRSSSASGCCATRASRPASPHVAALLQRRRLRRRRPLRHEPAQPLPARLRRAARRAAPRASTATTTRPRTAPACATTSTSPTSPPRTSPRPSGSTPASRSSRSYNLGSGDGVSVGEIMTRGRRGHRHRVHARDRARGAPATPPASSRPASSPPATSTGGCGTRLRRDGRERVGGPRAPPDRVDGRAVAPERSDACGASGAS